MRLALPCVLALGLLAQTAEGRSHGFRFHFGNTSDGPGPTASELVPLLETFSRADPLVCGLAVDALLTGAFLNESPGEEASTRPWKESLLGPVTAPDAIALLAGHLKDTQSCVRRLSAELLGRSTSAAALARLRTALVSPSPLERQAAALGLGARGEASTRELLERALTDTDAAVASTAAWALGELEDARSVPALLAAAKSPNARIRKAAAEALGHFDDNRALPALIGCLRDSNAEVRAAAAASLSQSETTPAVQQALRAALADASPDVRREAAQALGR